MRTVLETTRNFIKSEDGAVTADWVVLTAALVGLGLATMTLVSGGVEDLSGEIQAELVSMDVGDRTFGGSTASTSQATPYDGLWLRSGDHDSYSSVIAGLTDQGVLDRLNNPYFQSAANPANGTNGAYSQWHDEYWLTHNEAVSRGLDIPSNEYL